MSRAKGVLATNVRAKCAISHTALVVANEELDWSHFPSNSRFNPFSKAL